MAVMTIASQEYNEETGIYSFVTNPGNLTCELKIVDGEVQQLAAGKWIKCANPFLKKAVLEAAEAQA